jgi:hypothetical protein
VIRYCKCLNCGAINEEDEMGRFQDDHGVTDPFPVYTTFLRCPECLCEDIEDFIPCLGDDCLEPPMPGEDYCAGCLAEIEQEQSA